MTPEEIIAEAFNTEIVGHSGDYNGGRLTYSRSLDLARQGLAALKAAGYEVVKLPEPDSTRYEGDEHEPEDRDSWTVDLYEVAVWDHGEVQINYDGNEGEPVGSAIARDLASALLAAAAAAEEQP